MMSEAQFHAVANATLLHIYDQLEPAFDEELLDELEYDEGTGILTIALPDGRTFILSKHTPSGQLWWASPISGGLHFHYHDGTREWQLDDERRLKDVIRQELEKAAEITVVL